MNLLINFFIPIMFTALNTELTCLLERAKENGGARLVLTPEAFMPKYAELKNSKGKNPIFLPFTYRHHSLIFQVMTLSGALPTFRPTIHSNGVFGITSMFSSFIKYSCDVIEDLEACHDKLNDELWSQSIPGFFYDEDGIRVNRPFSTNPEDAKYIAKTKGYSIIQCSAVFNIKNYLDTIDTSYDSILRMGEIVSDFVKKILNTSTIDIPDFEIEPFLGAKAIMEFRNSEIKNALPLGDCTDDFNVDALVETKKNMTLNETKDKRAHILTIDEENINILPDLIEANYNALKKNTK